MFQKWIGWDTDPVSGPVSEVAIFLADLYDKVLLWANTQLFQG